MGFRKPAEQTALRPFLFTDEHGHIVFVDPFLWIVKILPDEAAVLPVLRDGCVPDDRFIFIDRVEIEQKQTARVQIIVHQAEGFKQVLFLQQIIQAVADADHGADRAVQLEFPHILFQIKDVLRLFGLFFQGDVQHGLRIVHADHIIPFFGKEPGHRSRAAAEIQHQPIPDAVLSQTSRQEIRPVFIGGVVHESIIDLCKIRICFHLKPPFCLISLSFQIFSQE